MKSLTDIFTQLFPSGGAPDQMQYQVTQGWDSLNHMKLCALIEENFDIMLEINDIAALSSFSAAEQIVSKHTVRP